MDDTTIEEERLMDERLRAHFTRLAPGRGTLDPLVDALAETRARHRAPRRALLWGAAASVLALSIALVQLDGTLGARTERVVVREAAMNHNTRLSLEFDETTLGALNGAMTQLPFRLRRPERLDDTWTPLGGRYCSIAGHLAAHVKLASADGRGTMSLFVTREAPDLERIDGRHPGIDGVDVELWDEDGLFYAMARSAS